MQQYDINYSKTSNIIATVVLPSLLIVPVAIFTAVYLKNISENAKLLVIMLMVFSAGGYAFFMAKKRSPAGVLTLNDDGFVVEFPARTRYTPDSFEIKAAEITKHYTADNEGFYYMHFTTSVRPTNFSISAVSWNENDTASFATLMTAMDDMIRKSKIAQP